MTHSFPERRGLKMSFFGHYALFMCLFRNYKFHVSSLVVFSEKMSCRWNDFGSKLRSYYGKHFEKNQEKHSETTIRWISAFVTAFIGLAAFQVHLFFLIYLKGNFMSLWDRLKNWERRHLLMPTTSQRYVDQQLPVMSFLYNKKQQIWLLSHGKHFLFQKSAKMVKILHLYFILS